MPVIIENYLSRAHQKGQVCPLETLAYGEAREACNIPAILTSDEPPRAFSSASARETALLGEQFEMHMLRMSPRPAAP